MSTRKLWKFASHHGWTLVLESSKNIAAQVVKGQVIEVTHVPAIKIEFRQQTREYTTTDANIAEKLLAHSWCGKRFWAVKGFCPKLIEGGAKEVSKFGPEAIRKEPIRVITTAKSTGTTATESRSFNTGITRVKEKVG